MKLESLLEKELTDSIEAKYTGIITIQTTFSEDYDLVHNSLELFNVDLVYDRLSNYQNLAKSRKQLIMYLINDKNLSSNAAAKIAYGIQDLGFKLAAIYNYLASVNDVFEELGEKYFDISYKITYKDKDVFSLHGIETDLYKQLNNLFHNTKALVKWKLNVK